MRRKCCEQARLIRKEKHESRRLHVATRVACSMITGVIAHNDLGKWMPSIGDIDVLVDSSYRIADRIIEHQNY